MLDNTPVVIDGMTLRDLFHDWPVGHAELGAEMFRQQSDGFAVGVGIGLRQVPHGFHEHLLAFDVALITDARRTAALGYGNNGKGKDSGHDVEILMIETELVPARTANRPIVLWPSIGGHLLREKRLFWQ